MEICVTSAQGIPEKAYLSIRVGETRRQMALQDGDMKENFHFDVKKAPKHFAIDVFQKIGTKTVSMSDLQSKTGADGILKDHLQMVRPDGSSLKMDMKVAFNSSRLAPKKKDVNANAATAKDYLDDHQVQELLHAMVHELLTCRPEDPESYMSNYIERKRLAKLPEGAELQASPKKSAPPVAGEAAAKSSAPPAQPPPVPGGAPQKSALPVAGSVAAKSSAPVSSAMDLSTHQSIVAKVLSAQPSLFPGLSAVRTPNGVSLSDCVKPTVENKGEMTGLVAGDAFCFDMFRDVFDPVISQLHSGYSAKADHPTAMDAAEIDRAPIDPTGKHISAVQVSASRNLDSVRFSPAMAAEERQEVERLLTRAFMSLTKDLEGEYLPLRGSSTFLPRPGGMSEEDERGLRSNHLFIQPSTSAELVSAGVCADWPEARGVFVTSDKGLSAAVNELDHLRLVSRLSGSDLGAAFDLLSRSEQTLCQLLEESGHSFARTDALGFLTVCPASLGSGLQVSVSALLPNLSAQEDFQQVCSDLGLSAKHCGAGEVEISCGGRLGETAASQANRLIAGCRHMLELELDDGSAPRSFANEPGLGDSEWPGFPADVCPEAMPDLSRRYSIAADILRKSPSIYDELRTKTTPLGVPFAKCVKTSFDNNGHPMIKTIGAVAGDEHCYDVFSSLFDPLIQVRHPTFEPDSEHVTDFRSSELSSEPLDASGERIVSVRARLSLNFSGMRMPPAISKDERREVERIAVEALQSLTGELEGEYFPLAGSESHPLAPGGMSTDDEDRLREDHLIFDEPDSEVLLSSGFGRHWPDARGVFVDNKHKSMVWVNEEDHLRLATMQPGGDIKDVFTRLYALRAALAGTFEAGGRNFAHSRRLGFLGSCASNLGTCMVASATLRLPLVSSQPKFRAFCKMLKLNAHVAVGSGLPAGQGIWEVSNAQRLGNTEVEQVSSLIEGVKTLLDLEAKLERGEEVPAMTLCTTSEPLTRSVSAAGEKSNPAKEAAGAEPEYFADIPGLGPQECPGFPTDACPTEMPDFSKHYSIMADVLKQTPDIYARLAGEKTKSGVSLAKCMKMGVDNPGHPMIKTIGACAGDAECYEVFRDFFDPIIAKKHKSYSPEAGHVTDLDYTRVSKEAIDPSGQHVVATSVRAHRSVTGARFSAAVTKGEREEIERLVTDTLLALTGELGGSYFPLCGSESYGAQPDGMTDEDEAQLEEAGLLFREPDAQLSLSSGIGRDWPHGRGVFANESRTVAVHVNDEEHLRFAVERRDGDLQGAFEQFCRTEAAVGDALRAQGRGFASSSQLGFLASCPGNLGTGLSLEVRVKLPKLSELPEFKSLQRDLGVRARCVNTADKLWAVQSLERLGSTEVQQVEALAKAIRQLVAKEVGLTGGSAADAASGPLPKPGPAINRPDSKASTRGFSAEECPAEMPDFSAHHSKMAEVLRADPGIYEKLRACRTARGVTFARCIKPGADTKGHQMVKTVGAVAGDAESYETFQDFFRPLLAQLHPSFTADRTHVTELDAAKLDTSLPVVPAEYVVSTRLRASRNLASFRFPSADSQDEKIEVERAVTEALSALSGNLAGEYLPISGSDTFPARPGGMTQEEEDELEKCGLLFQEPDAALAQSSGIGRHWPLARGVFANASRSFAAWLNEEDHVKLMVVQPGGDLREAFLQFCLADGILRDTLQQQGHVYARSETHGFLTTCPQQIGTGGMRMTVAMKLPLLGAHECFKAVCTKHSVRAAPGDNDSWAVSSTRGALGVSEAEMVTCVAEACCALVAAEQRLERGEELVV